MVACEHQIHPLRHAALNNRRVIADAFKPSDELFFAHERVETDKKAHLWRVVGHQTFVFRLAQIIPRFRCLFGAQQVRVVGNSLLGPKERHEALSAIRRWFEPGALALHRRRRVAGDMGAMGGISATSITTDQPLAPPDPREPFGVYPLASVPQQRRDPTIAIAGELNGERHDIGRQGSLIIGPAGLLALRGSVLPQNSAGEPFGNAILDYNIIHACAATRGG